MRRILDSLRYRTDRSFVAPLARASQRRINAHRELHPLFVLGAMGSGTSLIAFSIASNLRVAGIADESTLTLRHRSRLRTRPVARFRSVEAYFEHLLPRPDWEIAQAAADLQHLYRGVARGEGTIVVDKAPNANMVRASFLAEAFPNAKFAVVVRDPVATVEGFCRKWPLFRRAGLQKATWFYQALHTELLRQANELEGRLWLMPYEDFVENPAPALQSLAKSAGLEEGPQLVPLGAKPNRPGQGIRNVRNGEIEIVRGANETAYQNLSAEAVSAIREQVNDTYAALMNLPRA